MLLLIQKNGKMGYGGIVRDSQGKVHAAYYLYVDILVEPVVGEALAALHLVEFYSY